MSKTTAILLVLASALVWAASMDEEIVSNLDFFVNYEYVEYQDEFEVPAAEEVSAINEKDIRDISAIGAEEVNSPAPQETR
jgi:hypothetical protein